MYKRILSLVLSLLMVISLVPSATAAEESEVNYNSAHVDMVAGLGLMQQLDNGRFLGDINLRWDEFSYILRQFGFNPAEHENTEVTVNEIAEHFVFIAGYEKLAAGDAFSQAASWGIFNGLGVSRESTVTRYQMASIIAEFLDVNVVLIDLPQGYELDTNATVLSEILKAQKLTGIVTDNGFSALTGETKVWPCKIVIDDKFKLSVDVKQYDVSGFLGHKVDIIYKLDRDAEYAIAYIGRNRQDKVLKIEASDIKSITSNSVSYYVNNKTKTESISNGFICIKNGESLASYTTEDLIPKSGYIEIIKNGSGTDCLVVKSYEDYIVSGVLNVNGEYTIYSMTQTNNKNDFIKFYEDSQNVVIKSKKGSKLGIKDITEGKTLTVAQSSAYMEIIVTENVITDFEFQSLTRSQDGWVLKSLIGMEFKVTDAYMQKHDDLAKTTIGDVGTVYLNAFGEVAFYEASLKLDSELNYGCLVGATYNSNEDSLVIKILESDGTKHVFNVAEKITITDDINVTAKYEPERAYAKLYGKNEIVRFNVSSTGELKKIVLFPYLEEFVKPGEMKKIYEGDVTYYSTNKTFGKFVHRNTVYFIVDSENKDRIDQYAVTSDTSYLRSSGSYTAKAYGAERSYADYVIIYNIDENNMMPRSTSKFGVVVDMGYRYSAEEGETVPYVVYNVDGTETEVLCENADVIERAYDMYSSIPSDSAPRYQVQKGDIVRFYSHPITKKAQSCTILFSTGAGNPSFPTSQFGFIPGAEIGANNGSSTKCNPFAITTDFTISRALNSTSGYNNRIMLGWVYDNFDTIVEVTNQDLSVGTYEGITYQGGGVEGWSTEMPSIKKNPVIIEYHRGQLEGVRVGTIDDVRSYKDFSNDCSAYLTVYREYAGMMQSFIINHTK